MTKEKTNKQKNYIAEILLIFSIFISVIVSLTLQADQIVHKFKSPSFNGEATSSYYLTI